MSIYGNMFENAAVIAANSGIGSNNYAGVDLMESMLDFTFEYSVLENSYIIESSDSNLSVLKENAIKTIWNKIKQFIQWLWEQIKKLGTIIANFFKNLFSRNKQNEAKAKIIEQEIKKKDPQVVKEVAPAVKNEIKTIESKFDYSKPAGFPTVDPTKLTDSSSSALAPPDNGGSKDLPAVSNSKAKKAEKKVGGVNGQVARLVDKSTANDSVNTDEIKKNILDKVKKFMTSFNFATLFPAPRGGLEENDIVFAFGTVLDAINMTIDKNEFTGNNLGEFKYMDNEYTKLKRDIYHSFFFEPSSLKFKGKAPTESNPFAATKPMWIEALNKKMSEASKDYNKSFNWDPFDKSFLGELKKYSNNLQLNNRIFTNMQKNYEKEISKIKELSSRVSNASTFNFSEKIEGEGDDARSKIMEPKMATKWLGDVLRLYALNVSMINHVIGVYGASAVNITKLHNFVFALVKDLPNQKAA